MYWSLLVIYYVLIMQDVWYVYVYKMKMSNDRFFKNLFEERESDWFTYRVFLLFLKTKKH